MRRSRTAAALLTLALVPGLVTLASAGASSGAAPADGYRATITRTQHGIPHIVADDFGSLGYGEGFATAETSICNLADTVLTVRGQRSQYLGPDRHYRDGVTLDATNLQTDTLFTDIRNRRVVQRLLADPRRGPGRQTRSLVRGYAAGVNAYLRSVGGSRGIHDPECRGKPWVQANATPLDIWYAVYAANLLASTGVFVPQIADASPRDLTNPTDGLPAAPSAPGFAQPPTQTPSRKQLLTRLGRDPDSPFGSNATAVGSGATTTRKGMLLGNPHFPWRGRYRFTQFHLTVPGRYDVAGAGLIGSPVVNIGWNNNVAWSHTVSTAYRFTPYEYRLVPGRPTTYLTEDGPTELTQRVVHVRVKHPDGTTTTVTRTLYRTHEGYVLDAPDVLMPWSHASVFALRDANAEHLRTVDTFFQMAKAHDVGSLLRAQDRGAGMPWVNTIAADRDGHALYADHSVVPNVPDDLVQQCSTPTGVVLEQLAGLPALDGTRARSGCAWRTDADAERPGIFGPSHLPREVRRDWVANANDSYWLPNPKQPLEGYPGIIGCERCERTLRTRMVYRYVLDRLAGTDGLAAHHRVSPTTLAATEHQNRVYGAEVARAGGDLDTVCRLANGGSACDVLHGWDGHSDIDSRGTHVFQEFWKRAQNVPGLWQVPFDAADPVNTPRDLNQANPLVVKAMRDALDYLHGRGIADDARWGTLQVAGDDGAPPIPIGGGEGFAGNVNAVSSRDPAANPDRPYAVSYGSSHIQAVAFLPDRRLVARTILTYSESMDRTAATSSDQTRLFSQERWVRFPWTPAQVRRDAVRTYVVSGR
ncbi:MAG: acylase [Nocardioidaceae bacterium]|nr:acylase [Nocardioidaceae bacterium]